MYFPMFQDFEVSLAMLTHGCGVVVEDGLVHIKKSTNKYTTFFSQMFEPFLLGYWVSFNISVKDKQHRICLQEIEVCKASWLVTFYQVTHKPLSKPFTKHDPVICIINVQTNHSTYYMSVDLHRKCSGHQMMIHLIMLSICWVKNILL